MGLCLFRMLDSLRNIKKLKLTYVESLNGTYIRRLDVGGVTAYQSVHKPIVILTFTESETQLVTHPYTNINCCFPSMWHALVSRPSSNVLRANKPNISKSVSEVVPACTKNDREM